MKQDYNYQKQRKGRLATFNVAILFISLLLYANSSYAQWTRKADALRNRGECPSILYNGKIYVFGGFGNHPNFEKDTEVYDPALNKWTLLAPIPIGKEVSHQGVVLVDDKVWHIGGRATNADGPVSSQVLIYDITNNSWTNGPQLKDPATGQALPLGGGGAALLGRTIHVFGGFGPTICIDQDKYHLTLDIDKYLADPTNTKWENKLAPMPVKRNHLNTTVLGGKIYAIGGQFIHDCGGADQKYVHAYDPITDSWKRLTDLPVERSHSEGATFNVDGKIYLVGGQGVSGAATNTVYVLDPAGNSGNGSWTTASQFQLPNNYYGISAKVVGSSFIISHGALIGITNERKETYTAPITRNIPNKFGFAATCFNKTVSQNQALVIKNLLFTIEGEKQYSLSSNASWLKVTKNATGLAKPSGVDVEVTIDASNLSTGNYTGNITVTGAASGTAFTSASFCVNLQVGTGTAGYSLTVSTSGSGTVTKNPNQTTYASGTNVVLTATPAAGYVFSGWSGAATGTTNPLTVAMTSNKTITATFTQVTGQQVVSYNLINADTDLPIQTITEGSVINLAMLPTRNLNIQAITNPSPVGSVKLALSGKQINNRTENGAPYALFGETNNNYSAWIPAVGSYKLTSTPYTLSSGSGTAGTPLTVNFSVIDQTSTTQYSLIVSTSGSGTVTKNPNQTTYASGTNVVLTATPAAGYVFSGWSGAATGTTNPLTVAMTASKTITATFTQVQSNDLVYDISSTTSRSYSLSELVVGAPIYTDRSHAVTTVPTSLNHATFIRTANDDKANTTTSMLSFKLSQSATVIVGYDPRATNLPGWLSGWQKLNFVLNINDPNITYLNLYSKPYVAGTVTLGGNLASPAAGAQSNYIVIVQAGGLRLVKPTTLIVEQDKTKEEPKLQVFPNPTNRSSSIKIALTNFAQQEKITVTLQDALGRIASSKTVIADEQGVAKTELSITSRDINQGIYFVRAHALSGQIQKKVLVIE